jgi:integrase
VLLLKQVWEKPAEIIFHLQMLHGLRIGEALGMTWENIDLKHNTITVNQQLHDISMKLRKGTRFETDSYQIKTIPKTVRSERNVPLQAPTKTSLLRTEASDRNGYVFKGLSGTSITYGNYRKRHFCPVIRALDLELTTHDFRRFFGSWHLGMNKTDIMTVSKWMGHRDPRVTLSTYAKVIEELEMKHQDAIGNALVPIAD